MSRRVTLRRPDVTHARAAVTLRRRRVTLPRQIVTSKPENRPAVTLGVTVRVTLGVDTVGDCT
jgi:hypothetical protein